MNSPDDRSMQDHLVGWPNGGAPAALSRVAGRARGKRAALGESGAWGARRHAARFDPLEVLETRTLLAGDHPSLPMPWVPGMGTFLGVGGGSATGVLEVPGDDDLFRFTVAATDFVTVLANTQGLMGTRPNTRVEVYDNTGVIVAAGTNNGVLTSTAPLAAPDGWAGFVATPGDYYVRVLGEFNTTGNYEVRVNAVTLAPAGPIPGPMAMTPGEFGLVGNITQVQGDVVFHIDVPADAIFDSLATVVGNAAMSPLDIRIEVFSATGARLAEDSDTGYLTGAFTAWRSVPSERFYIRVRSDSLTGASATGAFALTVDVAADELANPMNDITRRGSDTTHLLTNAADTDLFRFVAQGTGYTFITVIDFTNEGGFGLRLYDNLGTLLAFDDDFVGRNPQIEIQLVGGETYFLVVDSFEPPPTPTPLFPAPYGLFIEATHTFDPAIPIDDHADTPAATGTPDEIRRGFELATPLIWNAPRLYLDPDGNPILDRSWVTDAFGTGRIFTAPDTDLFQFTPPTDMRGTYPGNDDDAGTALYVGGAFQNADPNGILQPVNSRNLAIWDAGDWWFTGPQINGLGFADNPNTPFVGAEVMTAVAWAAPGNSTGRPMLVVGGDFRLVTQVGNFDNLAVWAFNGARYQWFGMGNPNNAVRAAAVFDPVSFDPDGDGPMGETGDPGGPWLYIGGDFTAIGGVMANRIASFAINQAPFDIDFVFRQVLGGWAALGAGVNNTVHALTVFDPQDPGDRRDMQDDPPIPEVADTPNPPLSLIVGGAFTQAGGVARQGVAAWTGQGWSGLNYGTPPTNGNVVGTVRALTVITVPDDTATGREGGERLIIGGQFTTAGGIAANNIVMYGRVASPDAGDPFSDPEGNPYQPRLVWEPVNAMQNGVNGAVFALAGFDTGDFHQLVVGGAFTNRGQRIAVWTPDGAPLPFVPGWAALGLGFANGEVRALAVVIDEQEPGTADGAQTVYAAGTFTMSGANTVNRVARWAAPNWVGLNTGTDGPVNTLAAFDDGIAGVWDRNDRTSSRVRIRASGADGSFLNAFITIYDSNFQVIYQNDTVVPFPDPAGSNDPALGPGQQFIGPPLHGGETYYIEVRQAPGSGARQTGRYNLTVTVDAFPPDVNGDGVRDDPISVFFEEPDAGNWTAARRITVDTNTAGDGSNRQFVENQTGITQGPPVIPAGGSSGRRFTFPRSPTPAIGATPSRFLNTEASDYASIHSIDDTDLYYFRANGTGYVEIRINTTNIPDFFFQRLWDLNNFPFTAEETLVPDDPTTPLNISSKLASRIRVFNNDLIEIGTSAYNPAVGGELDTASAGTFPDRTFFHRDARLVIPVTLGQVYFVQIESALLAAFNADPTLVDWRYATGKYELLVDAISDFDPDYSDDHAATNAQATPIPINTTPGSPDNGRGSVSGVIQDIPVFNPNDIDRFSYFATGTGQISLSAVPGLGSTIALSIIVRNDTGGVMVAGLGLPGATVNVSWFAQRGQRFFIDADGGGGSQGAYVLNLVGQPYVDDHADVGFWIDATPLSINRYLGTAIATGAIEEPGDTDLFVFTATTHDIASVLVQTTDESLDTFVRVYEIGLDGVMNPVFMRIGENDNSPTDPTQSFTTFSVTPGRPYYVIVSGANPDTHFGQYTLTVRTRPTDDHPDFADFPLATVLTVSNDPVSGAAVASSSGTIEIPIDDDVFRFTAPASGMAVVAMSRTSGDFDPIVRVFNSAGVEVPGSPGTDIGNSGNVLVTFDVVRNVTYFIVVDVDTGGGTGTYNLNLFTAPSDDHANIGEFDRASRITLSTITGIGSRTGIILPSIDTDLFYFRTLAAGPVSIVVTTPTSNLNPVIIVYDASFQVIPGSTSDGESAFHNLTATAPNQLFYVLVAPDSGAPGTAQIGSYIITVTGDIGVPGGGTDDHPNAGDFGIATPIPLDPRTGDGSLAGIINFVGDNDLFTFVTPLGHANLRPVYVQVTTPTGGLINGSLRIFDDSPQHNQIIANSNGIPGATAAASFNAVSGARYFVLVEPVGANTGSYAVRVDAEPTTHFLYYPEGYSSSTIDEFLPIVNPNNFDVTYTVIARYEVGVRDQVIVSSALIPANSRGGITISTRGNPDASLVRRDEPYALEIQSTGQLGATFSHYDFGVTTGENFTSTISTIWTFAEARRDPLNFRDFAVFYNPNDADANLTFTLYYDDGTVSSFSRTLGALRRGGLNFTNDSAINKNGRFGLRVTSDLPIVAALSSYDITNGRGYGLLGDPNGGSSAGVVPSLSTGNGVESFVSILNTSSSASASVTLTFRYSMVNLPDLVRVINVPPNQRRAFTLAELGLVSAQPAGLRFSSAVPVTVNVAEYQSGDGDAYSSGVSASTQALFGDAFVNPAFAGTTYIETLGLFNPASTSAAISITFLFTDGTISAPVNVNVPGGRFASIRIDQQQAILSRPGPTAFSIRVTADTPFIASFTHYDLFLNGGWSTLGSPVGLTNPVSTIL